MKDPVPQRTLNCALSALGSGVRHEDFCKSDVIVIFEASVHLDSKEIYIGGPIGGSVGGGWGSVLWLQKGPHQLGLHSVLIVVVWVPDLEKNTPDLFIGIGSLP